MISLLIEKYKTLGKNRQDILWNVFSFGVMGVCGVALNFIIASIAGAEALGVFNQVYAVYIIASQFSALGVHLSVLKYVAEFSHEPKTIQSIFTSGITTAALMSIITCGVIWIIRSGISVWVDSPSVAVGITWSLPGLFFFTLNKIEFSVLNGLSRMKLYAAFQSLRYILMVLFAVIILQFGTSYEKLPLLFSISEILLFIAMVSQNKISFDFQSLNDLQVWGKKHLVFGFRGFMSNVLTGLNTRVDVLLLGYFCSDRVVGIFSLAAIAAEGIYQLAIVLRTNINPYIVQLISSGKSNELIALSKRAIRSTYLIISLVGALLIIAYPLGLFFVKDSVEFFQSWPIFIILVVSIAVSAGYIPFGNILLLAGHPGKHSFMIAIQVIFNIVGDLILIPLIGVYGAAIATGLSNILLVILIKQSGKRILNIKV